MRRSAGGVLFIAGSTGYSSCREAVLLTGEGECDPALGLALVAIVVCANGGIGSDEKGGERGASAGFFSFNRRVVSIGVSYV